VTARFFGQPLRRIEDPRLLRGEATFVEDLARPGMLHVVFVRSPHAHARFRVDAEPARRHPEVRSVLTAAELSAERGFGAIPLVVPHPALGSCQQRPLATDAARYVGEAVAVVVADTRASAEDAASLVEVTYEPLDPIVDVESATLPGAARLHDGVTGNVAAAFTVGVGDVEAAFATAEVVTRGRYEVQRYTAVPMEPRGVVAAYDVGTGDLTVWSSTQWPHTLRDVLRDLLALGGDRIRVIAPDVGGGFGVKQEIYPEEIALALLARRLRRPLKWIETRREHLATAAHARQQTHDVELAARRDGTILALRAQVTADVGAYTRSLGVLCPSITAAMLPGPYRIRHYACRVRAVLTSKAPASAYRGAGLPEAVFALERAVDQLARELDLDPAEIRRRNFIRPDEFPWATGTGSAQVPVVYDSGDYAAGLDAALTLGRYAEWRATQRSERARGEHGRLIGIGVACYVMLTGLGPYESALLRVDPTGRAVLVVGASPHGQGTATALAQLVADELGLRPDDITVRHGDTAAIPFGVGTYASRNAVMAGSAAFVAARHVAAKARRLAAHLLEADERDVEIADGRAAVVGAPHRAIGLGALAAASAPGAALPPGMEPGLEATHYFTESRSTFASGVHVAVVEIDRETGAVAVVDYSVVNDSGRIINPLIAEGQIHGGVAQGIGGALYEELAYDGTGQLLSQSLLDYVVPTSAQIPPMRLGHVETPSPLNPLGVKGLGEGGAVAPPPAIAAAVEDALREFGARITRTPLRPETIFHLMQTPGAGARPTDAVEMR
jgi:carbon-monoxide dehydrogenase large subunit